jgi:glucose-1-phosphate cytidylyltransferase
MTTNYKSLWGVAGGFKGMKVAILAGGKGTRFSEETVVRPKPMIEVGGRPILWHIMMHYYASGLDDFVVALGYKSDFIKNWFAEQKLMETDLGLSGNASPPSICFSQQPNCNVNLVETGLDTQTGGRVKALASELGDAPFILAWGDGVSDVDVAKLQAFHADHGKLATMVIVRPPARFGHVGLDGDQIVHFEEKPAQSEGWINGGVFILEPEVLHYIRDASTHFEKEPLETLAREGQLMAYRHEGFWQCMDNGHDRNTLEQFWIAGNRPWVTWEDVSCVSS